MNPVLQEDVVTLRAENTALRAQIDKMKLQEDVAQKRRRKIMAKGGRILLPLFDRKRVVRNFMALLETCTAYAGPKELWPPRDEVLARAQEFSLSVVRFAIRRRLLIMFFTLIAFSVPALQVWLIVEQNRLVDMQNELITIQADDIIARGVTSDNLLTNQINGALLSGRDITDLNRMLSRIFSADMGDIFSGGSNDATRELYLRGTAGRAHLLLALAESIKHPKSDKSLKAKELWAVLNDPKDGAFASVSLSSADRLFLTLNSTTAAFRGNVMLEAECQRYLLGLSYVLRRAFSLAVTVKEQQQFFASVAELFARASRVRPGFDKPLVPIFAQTFGNFLVDLALEPAYGAPDKPVTGNVDELLRRGFKRLQEGVGDKQRVDWPRLRALLEVGG